MTERSLLSALAVCLAAGAAAAQGSPHGGGPSQLGAYLGGIVAAERGDVGAAARLHGRALERDPGSEQLALAAMASFAADGQVESAVAVAERLLEAGHGGPAIRLVAFAGAVARDDWERAAGILEPSPAGAGPAPSMMLDVFLLPVLSAWVASAAGDPEERLRALDSLAGRGALAPLHDFHAGLILRSRHETSRAGLHFSRAEATQGRPIRVSLAIAAHHRETGRDAEADRILGEIAAAHPLTGLGIAIAEGSAGPAELDPGVARPRDGLAEAFHDGARMLLSESFHRPSLLQARLALFLRPDFPAGQLLLGEILASMGADEEAVAAFRSVSEAAPEAWDAGMLLAERLADTGGVSEAERTLRQLAARHAGRTGALSALGRVLSNAGRQTEAVDAFTEAIGRAGEPARRDWALFYGRAFALDQDGQWERAEEDLQRALELEPGQPLVLNYLAYSWIEQGQRLETARRMVEEAVAQRPRNGAIIDSLGWAQYRLGEFEDAVKTLERALAAQPGDPVIVDHYGDALWQAGRHVEARFQWRSILRSDPDEEMVREVERKLEEGLDPPPPPAEEKEI